MGIAVTPRVPGRWQASSFAIKAACFRLKRVCSDGLRGRPPEHGRTDGMRAAPLLAESEQPLWPQEEIDRTFVLGKIQNMRIARTRLHGIEIPAHQVFSFWRQLRRPAQTRGYVVGRELREGCLIPAIGGGLCQLSNTIYDCAVRAGVGVVERHAHTRILPGSLAEQGRDATVFWNYVDLRLVAEFDWRLEVEMDAERLRVRIRGNPKSRTSLSRAVVIEREGKAVASDCVTCGKVECRRHIGTRAVVTHRFWWIEEAWPEFVDYWMRNRGEQDRMHGPCANTLQARRGFRFLAEKAYWKYGRWLQRPIPQLRMEQMRRGACDLADVVRAEDVDMVIPQSLLPFLWEKGVLAGRRYQVLMTALPMHAIEAVLDFASLRHPEMASLRDFRAPTAWIEAEREALAHADACMSPHAQIQSSCGDRAVGLTWNMPKPVPRNRRTANETRRVLFPASALARKGILELLAAVRDRQVEILLPPGDAEIELDAGGSTLRRVPTYREGLGLADVVALPAWIEHQPRGLLAALASGIPVIATPECGLPPSPSWRAVKRGDVEELRLALDEALH